jgi:hypothetical protein
LYRPSKQAITSFSGEDQCSFKSTNEIYLASYGYDYFKALKEREGPHERHPTPHGSPASSAEGRSSPSSSHDNQASQDSLSTAMTPKTRYVYIPTKTILGKEESAGGSEASGASSSSGSSQTIDYQPHLTTKMRAILVDWLIELSEEYKLSPNTLHFAVILMDKSLQCGRVSPLSSSQGSLSSPGGSEPGISSNRLMVERDMLQCLGW